MYVLLSFVRMVYPVYALRGQAETRSRDQSTCNTVGGA